MHTAAPHPDPYFAPLSPPADPDRTAALLPPALLLASHEMFHRMMAAPWANRPPARGDATSCP
ncbi:hypothetical protein [Streptomyces sp. S.PB5]|uniref:hypothetical protein n=1 Tax=Streptomyces sp. S.PB5 TaxID=3020844 RepID=UPI0025AF71F0|nr:hypothetical protein [Streptomyces sp. S.PB5]MDN3029071.1 hypothetical protein [Streptomyces sp. S.PB5]